jgi:hypothetical protein
MKPIFNLFAATALALALAAPSFAQTAGQPSGTTVAAQVTGLVVMTPTGPATCATWVQSRSPGVNPVDTAATEYWVEGYLSGLAVGSHRDMIGSFRHDALAAWLDRYCTANPQTKLPMAVHALAAEMVTHRGGQL